MTGQLALVTATTARGHDLDEPLLLAALAARRVEAAVVDWDDPEVDWSTFDHVVLRSTWDYVERYDDFLGWARRVAATTQLSNGIEAIDLSIDKHYLGDLERVGVPVTPTLFVEVGEPSRFPEGSEGFIVKPAVGAGGRYVRRFRAGETDDATGHVALIHSMGSAALIQPFLPLVAEHGEWPMIYIDGRFSHAANKRVTLGDTVAGLFARELNTAATTTPEMRLVADRAMEHIDDRLGPQLYARIDLVLGLDGRPCVLEAELVEPSLFLPEHPPAADTFADALARRVDRSR